MRVAAVAVLARQVETLRVRLFKPEVMVVLVPQALLQEVQ